MGKVDAALAIAKCKSRSEFVEEAIRYYLDHLISCDVHEYLTKELRDEFHKAAVENENRMRSLIFRWAVELNMMCHTIAAHFRADPINRRQLRAFAVKEVMDTNGNVSFDHALDVQRQGQFGAVDEDEFDYEDEDKY
jgi:hypothetical protein